MVKNMYSGNDLILIKKIDPIVAQLKGWGREAGRQQYKSIGNTTLF